MSELNSHPSAREIEEFAIGNVRGIRAVEIAAHLAGCTVCNRIASEPLPAGLNATSGDTGNEVSSDISIVGRPNTTEVDNSSLVVQADIPKELRNHPEYEVVCEISRGGMGVVYKVFNRGLDRFECLKVIQQSLVDEPGSVERFRREMQSAARLNHSQIVQAYHSPTFPGMLAFTMEYVEGIDLLNLVSRNGRLPIANACYYIAQAAEGLQHAFEHKMVHRDIKPNNLVLRQEGDKQIVKILDFGLAKATSERPIDGRLTAIGEKLGTPHYMAPEQFEDPASADIRADIYSLGCTFYYLLTGKDPLWRHAKSLFSLLKAHGSEEPDRIDQIRSDVPKRLIDIVNRMMSKSPDKRFQTPDEVVKVLQPYFQDRVEPISLPEQGDFAFKSDEYSPTTIIKIGPDGLLLHPSDWGEDDFDGAKIAGEGLGHSAQAADDAYAKRLPIVQLGLVPPLSSANRVAEPMNTDATSTRASSSEVSLGEGSGNRSKSPSEEWLPSMADHYSCISNSPARDRSDEVEMTSDVKASRSSASSESKRRASTTDCGLPFDANQSPLVPMSTSRRWLNEKRTAIALLAILVVISIVYLFNAIILVQTSEGTLVIDANVPNPDVFVDGDRITVEWGSNGQQAEIRVETGERLIEIKKDGYEVASKKLTIDEKKQKFFEARLEPRDADGQQEGDGSKPAGAIAKKDASTRGTLTSTGDINKTNPGPNDQSLVSNAREGNKVNSVLKIGTSPGERRSLSVRNVEFAFRWCPAGQYMVGIPMSDVEYRPSENQVEVTLTNGFWMLETEVTQKMWTTVMGTEKSDKWLLKHGKGDSYPATRVDWSEAKQFGEELTKLLRGADEISTDWKLDLPSEVEWEIACRAGAKVYRRFSFGSDESVLGEFAWIDQNSGKTAHPVGSKKSNDWGLFDMHGLVREWTDTWYEPRIPSGVNPSGPTTGSFRVLRGSGYMTDVASSRASYRPGNKPTSSDIDIGFRICAVSVGAGLERNSGTTQEPGSPDNESTKTTEKTSAQYALGKNAGDNLILKLNNVNFEFRWCPPGKFVMGSPESDKDRLFGESQVEVSFSNGFWMLETEVTQGMWVATMGKEKELPWSERFGIGNSHPAYGLKWQDCKDFCFELTKAMRNAALISSSWKFDLPSEAEWEYGCRAGAKEYKRFCYGDDVLKFGEYAWFKENAQKTTHPVGTKTANDWGLHDMHGSVWEWTDSWFTTSNAGGQNPRGPLFGSNRVLRGGSFFDDPQNCRSAKRYGFNPSESNNNSIGIGFRLIAVPSP